MVVGNASIKYSPADTRLQADVQQGRLSVPTSFWSLTGCALFTISAANSWAAIRIVPECDYLLSSLSMYTYSVSTPGNRTLQVYSDSTAVETEGTMNLSSTDAVSTMTGASAPAPFAITASHDDAAHYCWHAFDDDATTYFRANADADTSITVDFGTAVRINKWRFRNRSDSNAEQPKRFKLQGSNNGTDWSDRDTAYASGDCGQGYAGHWVGWSCFNGSASYRYWRVYIVSSYGTGYTSIGEIELIAATNSSAPGAFLASLGSLTSGSGAGWNRLSIGTPYQMYKNTPVWIVSKGADGGWWAEATSALGDTIRYCRPDSLTKAVFTTDAGVTFRSSTLSGRRSFIPIVLNSSANHVPPLMFGREVGKNVFIPGHGLATISQSGVTLDCSALTAGTLYYVYAYVSSGILTLEAVTDIPVTSGGIKVKTGTTDHLSLGMISPVNAVSTYQSPIDVLDARQVSNAHNQKEKQIGKFPPYSSSTTISGTDTRFQAISTVFDVSAVCDQEDISLQWDIHVYGCVVGVAMDGVEPSIPSTTLLGEHSLTDLPAEVSVRFNDRAERGLHTFRPVWRAAYNGTGYVYPYTVPSSGGTGAAYVSQFRGRGKW